MKHFFASIKNFFLAPAGASTFIRVLPLVTVALISLLVFVFVTIAWEETNTVSFCGLTCHTMPPQYITHQASVHSNVTCEDCHLGRDVLGVMIPRKIHYSWLTGSALVTGSYEYPIVAKDMRPAIDACENCHKPETFTSDKLVEIRRYEDDETNSSTSTYLSLKIGGGTSREGLGFGIHWHVENPVLFYAVDSKRQQIPYIIVTNPDGTTTEYIDVESNLNPTTIKPDELQKMDCITCHNRVAHEIQDPDGSVDSLISRGLIAQEIPNVKKVALEKLTAAYAAETLEASLEIVATLADYYLTSYPDFYQKNSNLVTSGVQALEDQVKISKFPDQKMDWQTHPDNGGHIISPGCFRCHDGKHLSTTNESVRLECNICHSIPVVVSPSEVNAYLQLNRGFEPESHKNSNWINLHRTVFDDSCQGCHTIEDPGGISNTSFCSNSACHGAKYDFAGFNAPQLREILMQQAAALATPVTTTASPIPQSGVSPTKTTPTPSQARKLTWETIAPLMNARCTACHASNGMKGVDLSSYVKTLVGGTAGPLIIPGDPDGSSLIQVQTAATDHFGQFSASELATVREWILAGAPEK